MKRLCPFDNQSFHHVYSKSIYAYEIFTCQEEYQRMIQLFEYYKFNGHNQPFSQFILRKHNKNILTDTSLLTPLVKILAFCLMPTHLHFVLQQISNKGIETFMRRTLNAYSNYFNLRHNRRGPLWQDRFGNRMIIDEQGLNQRIIYVHYNPVKEKLASSPEKWPYSSASTPPGGVKV